MKKQYGKWKVIGEPHHDPYGKNKVLCRCECGIEKQVFVGHLKTGASKNCRRCSNVIHGCAKRGRSGSLERSTYSSYQNMLQRSLNVSSFKSAKCYRDRPVAVCKRWLKGGFKVFLFDMGIKPTIHHSLDRVNNNNLMYSPANCRWATPQEQIDNSSIPILITYKGESKSIAEWERALGVGKNSFRSRLNRGATPTQAVETIKGKHRENI